MENKPGIKISVRTIQENFDTKKSVDDKEEDVNHHLKKRQGISHCDRRFWQPETLTKRVFVSTRSYCKYDIWKQNPKKKWQST